jgi:hypothetical protein
MHDDPSARLSALISGCMGYIDPNETLLALFHQHSALQLISVVNCALALEHVSYRLNTLVEMSLGNHTGRHRQDVHANVLRADCLSRCTSPISEPLLPDIGLAWLDHRNAIVA